MGPTRIKVTVAQVVPGTPFPRLHQLLAGHPAALYALPEYFTAASGEKWQRQTACHYAADMAALGALSLSLDGVVLGGTVVEPTGGGLSNVSPCFERGRLRGVHRKVHPTARERQHGIVPGEQFRTLRVAGIGVATLVCADVLDVDSFGRAAAGRPDVVFVPTTSPLRLGEEPEEKERRDREIFVAGAARARAFVVKACATGRIYGGPLQGRSLVAAPWGELLARVPFHLEAREQVLEVELDLERLRAWRRAVSAEDARGAVGSPGATPDPGAPRPRGKCR